MKLSRLVAVSAVCLLLVSAAVVAAPVQTFTLTNQPLNSLNDPISPDPGAGYVFMYESVLQTPGDAEDEFGQPVTYTDYMYDYWIENGSTDRTIVSWTWAAGIYSGVLIPSPVPNKWKCFDDLPLPPEGSRRYVAEELFNSSCAPVVVYSYVTWDDGHQDIWPVFVPECFVPEPSSLLALAGLLGGFMLKRRG